MLPQALLGVQREKERGELKLILKNDVKTFRDIYKSHPQLNFIFE
jgi:hypothetical protein